MKKLIEALRLKHEANLSNERIAAACGMSKGAVHKYLALAKAKNISWPLADDMDEGKLEALLFPAKSPPAEFEPPDCPQIHQELRRKGVTLQLLWSEYAAVHEHRAYRYSQYCEYYRRWKKQQKRSMRQLHRAGEKLFIDYSGATMEVINRATGEIRRAEIFVAVLGASNYTFAEATWSQTLPDWIGSHIRAFEFFGGVSQLLIPDNLRSAVTKADRYHPKINTTYAEMATHYGTAVLPARSYKPKDKAKAEFAVQLVQRWILAALRHQQFFSLLELNLAIRGLLVKLNERPFQGLGHSRKDLFIALDQPALKALAQSRYEYAQWRYVKPGIDYHVQIEKRYYSVPHQLVGIRLDARFTDTSVEIFHKGRRVAAHARFTDGRFSTLAEHMPEAHREHYNWSPQRFINWAKNGFGPSTVLVVEKQFAKRAHPEQGYRACLGLLHLGRSYEPCRVEAACERALANRSANPHSIASILKHSLDKNPLPKDEPEQQELPVHNNVRGSRYYR